MSLHTCGLCYYTVHIIRPPGLQRGLYIRDAIYHSVILPAAEFYYGLRRSVKCYFIRKKLGEAK